jgi:hypothetical protein
MAIEREISQVHFTDSGGMITRRGWLEEHDVAGVPWHPLGRP